MRSRQPASSRAVSTCPVGFGLPPPVQGREGDELRSWLEGGWFDGHLRTQLNAYYNDYENFQVIVGYPSFGPVFGFELNVPNTTTIYGFEAQVEAVFGDLSLDAGLGDAQRAWVSSVRSIRGCRRTTQPRSSPGATPETRPGRTAAMAPFCHNLEGRDQTYAPEFTFNLGAQYDLPSATSDTLTPRINYGHVSSQWATLFENEARGDKIEARNIINAQLAWTHGEWVTTLYSTNLTDQHYVGALNSGLRFAGPPRQFGIRVMKAF